MTRGDEILATFAKAQADLGYLRYEHYQDDDIRAIVEVVGSKVERFFKTAVFPGSDVTDTFDRVINRLKSAGLGKNTRDDLHGFRELYNASKHDPLRALSLKATINTVQKARDAMKSLLTSGIGNTSLPVTKVVSKTLWITAYDVLHQGVTEIYVSVPWPDEDFATHLDIVWIKASEWDPLRNELAATGSAQIGAAYFAPTVYKKFHEDDFLEAAEWNGDYRDLIQILSKYEDRPTAGKLIPSLRRDHMGTAVLSAVALAGVDVVSKAEQAMTPEQLTNAILKRADEVYAMPDERPWGKEAAEHFGDLLSQVDFKQWSDLIGPFWKPWNPSHRTGTGSNKSRPPVHYEIDDMMRLVIT